MQLESFFRHYGIEENPFQAEEARHDPVFSRLVEQQTHPEFEKVLGEVGQASSAVVFGEKGSGKTAIRLQLQHRITRHNDQHPDQRVWIVAYDEFNSVLQRLRRHLGRAGASDDGLLDKIRLHDHMDAILSLAVTRLVDQLLEPPDDRKPLKTLRRRDASQRMDMAVLAGIYDQPASGSAADRFQRLRRGLRLGWFNGRALAQWFGLLMLVAGAGTALAFWLLGRLTTMNQGVVGVMLAAGVGLLGWWAWQSGRLWWLGRKIRQEVRCVNWPDGHLRQALGQLPLGRLHAAPLPQPGDQDSRYRLTQRLIDLVGVLGYRSMVVLVDRVDEPAAINGQAQRMRQLIWPMLNNKFLQQPNIGIKLLLPLELRHLLGREDPEFFQRARLDKQHMVDRLTWPGPLLYDLCTHRLRACQASDAQPVSLGDLFAESVGNQQIIDALDQMRQPRDALKFLHQVAVEHCATVPEDQPDWRIASLTLEQVRKQQARRIDEFHRGLSPA